ncbi:MULTISPECIES: hypothetical protein [Providencia]|uniref:Uncharacterized protein n=1 Tax=Providencia stuartii TaxID=588 RepID=A0ABD5L6H9_PROST|nr:MULTISPECIES: hypothetical protein [Providencia]ELR5045325.1 hypothetical protein [Providencia rettgeri]ELR5292857.1 hypothetical protein [Providencia stuartii]MCR4181536.1 hypothetical protein [Providencia vermicola]URE78944.1 hypothetical protein MWH14_01105 [Providencia stuartii]
MITPLKNNHLKTPSEHALPTNHDSSTLVNKVKNTWQAKTIENTKQLKLTTQEIENIKTFFTTLRVSDPKDIKNSEDHKTNFLALYKKLNRLSSEEKKRFIAGAIQLLGKPDTFDNQELLKKTFNHAFYRVNAVKFMLQPLTEQMNNQIGHNKLEDDGDDELSFV